MKTVLSEEWLGLLCISPPSLSHVTQADFAQEVKNILLPLSQGILSFFFDSSLLHQRALERTHTRLGSVGVSYKVLKGQHIAEGQTFLYGSKKPSEYPWTGIIGKKLSTQCMEGDLRPMSLEASCIVKNDNLVVEAAGASKGMEQTFTSSSSPKILRTM